MKKALIFGLLFLVGCSSLPAKKLMKNCQEADKNSGLFYCEEIPQKEVNNKR